MSNLMPHRSFAHRRRNVRGFTLIEILAALGLGAFVSVGIAALINNSLEDARSQQTAAYQAQVTGAANKFLRDNYKKVHDALDASGINLIPISLNALTAAGAGYLAPNFSATNPYNQKPCVLVRGIPVKDPILGITTTMLSALVVTEEGKPIAERELSYIAASAGRGAGFIKSVGGSVVASGSYGSWQLNAAQLGAYTATRCSATAAGDGHLASALFYNGPNKQSTEYLYRNPVPGHPELNQMNTPIGMTTNALIDFALGENCGTVAKIGIDTERNLLSCGLDQLWKRISTWKEPVADYAALATFNPTSNDGDVRLTLDTGRAFAFKKASGVWQALAVDQNGNLTLDGTLTAAEANFSGAVDVANNLTVDNQVDVAQTLNAQGLIAKTWVFSPAYQFDNTTITVGDPCNFRIYPDLPDGNPRIAYPTGTIISDKNGITMACHAPEFKFVYENGLAAP